MRMLDFHVVDGGACRPRPAFSDLPGNTRISARMIALLGGANYAIPGPYPHGPLRASPCVARLAGVATPLIAALKLRHAAPRCAPTPFLGSRGRRPVLSSSSSRRTPQTLGPKSANYLLTLAPAAGVGVALLAARSRRAQLAVALAVAFVGAVNIASVVDGRAGGVPAVGTYAPAIREVLEQRGATRGYAGYWDAQNLTWQSDMKLLIAPVVNCGDKLCPYNFFTIRLMVRAARRTHVSPRGSDECGYPCAAVDLDGGRNTPLWTADAVRLRLRHRVACSGPSTVVDFCYLAAVPDPPGRKTTLKRLALIAVVAAVLTGIVATSGSAASFVDSTPCPAQSQFLVCPTGQVGQLVRHSVDGVGRLRSLQVGDPQRQPAGRSHDVQRRPHHRHA